VGSKQIGFTNLRLVGVLKMKGRYKSRDRVEVSFTWLGRCSSLQKARMSNVEIRPYLWPPSRTSALRIDYREALGVTLTKELLRLQSNWRDLMPKQTRRDCPAGVQSYASGNGR